MKNTKERVKKELENLLEQAQQLIEVLRENEGHKFRLGYQTWYTRALPIVKQLIPERMAEFSSLYDKGISSYVRGNYYDYEERDALHEAQRLFIHQYLIFESSSTRLDDILTNIQGLVQAEILDSELDAATELSKAGHIRSSGTIAGIVLERHLAKVCLSKNLTIRKNPTISELNNVLRDASVYDIPIWRGIQHLTDIRNLCAHSKERDPTKEEVDELISGVEHITKTIS